MIYPFIVSNPGEAAQAKRRIAAVTHRPSAAAARRRGSVRRRARARAAGRRIRPGRRPRPPPARTSGAADRRDRATQRSGARGRRRRATPPDEALRRIDAWLCDLKDLAIKDGQHIYGRAPDDADAARQRERRQRAPSLIDALDGSRMCRPVPPARRIASGATCCRPAATCSPPIRAPCRRRPRWILGRLAADEVIRGYMQTHGEMPRALVIDLWGSATLAHRRRGDRAGPRADGLPADLGLMRPAASLGVEVLPCAAIGRAARRRDVAHLRPVPRSVPGADRAARCRGQGGRRARRGR